MNSIFFLFYFLTYHRRRCRRRRRMQQQQQQMYSHLLLHSTLPLEDMGGWTHQNARLRSQLSRRQ